MIEGVEFCAETHRYSYRGRPLPSVTGLLSRYGITDLSGIPESVLDFARLRGQAVHLAIHLAQQGTLDPSSLDPAIEPYLFAWDLFVEQHGYVSEHSERFLCDPSTGFAGMPDDAGYCAKGRFATGHKVVLDRKAVATVMPATAVQLAAYRHLLRVNDFPAVHRFAVQLKPNGTYQIHEYKDPADWSEFAACLTLYWRAVARNKE